MKLTEVFGLLLFKLLISTITCQEFNRTTTGVDFLAYVKRNENGAGIPGWKTYTMQDMLTMMEVISTKFSRVATHGVGADNVPYIRNKTYNESNAQVMTAEAAALINAQRRNQSFTVLLGIWQSDIRQQMETELFVALESAEIANRIYPGTVEGLVFSHHEIGTVWSRAKQTLDWLQVARAEIQSRGVSLRLGSRQKCDQLSSEKSNLYTDDGKVLDVRRKIVNVSDFIICEADPADHNAPSGPKTGFITVGYDLLNYRINLKRINPKIEVMGSTKWASKGEHPWENINNLRDYWIEADQWASKNNYHIWLNEAFDGPWKTWSTREAHFGWWRLKSNEDINKKEGFAEKIYDPVILSCYTCATVSDCGNFDVKNKTSCVEGVKHCTEGVQISTGNVTQRGCGVAEYTLTSSGKIKKNTLFEDYPNHYCKEIEQNEIKYRGCYCNFANCNLAMPDTLAEGLKMEAKEEKKTKKKGEGTGGSSRSRGSTLQPAGLLLSVIIPIGVQLLKML